MFGGSLAECQRVQHPDFWGFSLDLFCKSKDCVCMDLTRLKFYDPKDFPAYLPKLNTLYDDLFSGGKGFRSQFINKVGGSIGLSDRVILLLAQTIEFVHNASLLHDDLVDRSALRRGKTTAWLKHTPEYAVLAGDYLLARVMVNLSSHGNIKLIQYTSEIISDLLEGEWIQDSLVKDFAIELHQLDRVHNLKTASLFKWCLRAPFIAKENYNERLHALLEELGTILGLLFQRSDDLLDFDVRNYEGKAILGDLKSGYLNSFSVFVLKNLPQKMRDEAIAAQSLGQFKILVGEKHFEQRLQEFDHTNSDLIELYDHHLQTLSQLLMPEEQKLIAQIQPLARLLYWRKK